MSTEDIFISIIGLCVYMAPLAIVAGSKRCWGIEKTGWLLATIVFSWLALIMYHTTVLTIKERKARHRDKAQRQHNMEQAQRKKQLLEQRAIDAQAALQPDPAQTPPDDAPPPGNKDQNVEDSV